MVALGTQLGTRLGTTLGTGDAARDELAGLELYLAANLFSWMRADTRAESLGKVTQFTDRVLLPDAGGLANNARSIDANHAFAQATGANQVAAIATDAGFNNKEVAIFLKANVCRYASTLAATSWKFAHGSAGCRVTVVRSRAYVAGAEMYLCTTNNSLGNSGIDSYQLSATQDNCRIFDPTSTVGPTGVSAGWANGVPGYVEFSHGSGQSPNVQVSRNAASVYTAAYGGTPSTADPVTTMTIGAQNNGGNPGNFTAAEYMFANVISPELLTAQRRYIFLRYGFA